MKSLDAEGSKQALADAQAKSTALQARLDAEQGSLEELEQRIRQLLLREDNLYCIESRARRHDAEVMHALITTTAAATTTTTTAADAATTTTTAADAATTTTTAAAAATTTTTTTTTIIIVVVVAAAVIIMIFR